MNLKDQGAPFIIDNKEVFQGASPDTAVSNTLFGTCMLHFHHALVMKIFFVHINLKHTGFLANRLVQSWVNLKCQHFTGLSPPITLVMNQQLVQDASLAVNDKVEASPTIRARRPRKSPTTDREDGGDKRKTTGDDCVDESPTASAGLEENFDAIASPTSAPSLARSSPSASKKVRNRIRVSPTVAMESDAPQSSGIVGDGPTLVVVSPPAVSDVAPTPTPSSKSRHDGWDVSVSVGDHNVTVGNDGVSVDGHNFNNKKSTDGKKFDKGDADSTREPARPSHTPKFNSTKR